MPSCFGDLYSRPIVNSRTFASNKSNVLLPSILHPLIHSQSLPYLGHLLVQKKKIQIKVLEGRAGTFFYDNTCIPFDQMVLLTSKMFFA